MLDLIESLAFFEARENDFLRCFLNFPRKKELVHYVVHFAKVEHQVELAHISKIQVQHLNEKVDRFEIAELIVSQIHAKREKKARVAPINHFVCVFIDNVFHKIRELCVPRRHDAVHLLLYPPLFAILHGNVPL